jgi:hypothetical protein
MSLCVVGWQGATARVALEARVATAQQRRVEQFSAGVSRDVRGGHAAVLTATLRHAEYDCAYMVVWYSERVRNLHRLASRVKAVYRR